MKMVVHSISVKSRLDTIKSTQNEEIEVVNGRNSNVMGNISVICLSDLKSMDQNQKDVVTEDNETSLKCICRIAIFEKVRH